MTSVRSTQRNQLVTSNITGGAFHAGRKQVHTAKNATLVRAGSGGGISSNSANNSLLPWSARDEREAHQSAVKSQPKHFDF